MLLVADLGGSNTKLLLARENGAEQRSALLPALVVDANAGLLPRLAAAVGLEPTDVTRLIVTGGRHHRLGDHLGRTPVAHITELAAIGRGGLLCAGLERALVVSMGTGTAMVSAESGRAVHAGGLALGGGTLRGLGRRLLGASDPAALAALAARGRPFGAAISIAEIIGGGIGGAFGGEMPAAYFGRLDNAELVVSDADIAAGLLDMIGHITGHMASLTARAIGHESVVLTGQMVTFDGVREAALRFGGGLAGGMVAPPEPGFAAVRGALALALEQDAGSPS